MTDSLEYLTKAMAQFAQERDWDQYHSPKNITMALAGEVGELAECFQWLSEAESASLDDKKRTAVADEIADIQLYLVRLADKLGIDILEASKRKLEKNERKYPVAKARGNATKYTDL
ncbi:nucleotide pyrophosphohydrolase [Allohahella sp. A8]|uniref:nucleotide pyrophosphohydrolase n=1 Tax=Allohahella sp. A8 TaxID=3141461 RepID=UPI003A80FCB7